ncbi:MAG: hypothetical protein LBJ88_06510 [Campylobacteraceae bacterium]|jgi:hypothetical protein|nr:hypothetical protein [Campylobacteraceae bacterium]
MNFKNFSYMLLLLALLFTGCNSGKGDSVINSDTNNTTVNDNNDTNSSNPNSDENTTGGWNGNTDTPENPYINDDNYSVIWNNSQGFIRGTLANANVKIYDIENYNLTLDIGTDPIYATNTTDGLTIKDSGIIPIENILKDEKIYIVELSGGKDMYIDANNKISADNFILNNGTIRLAMSGFELKNIGFKVTVLTELVYQVAKNAYKSNDISSFVTKSDEAAQCFLKKDINYDGKINTPDIISWTPIINKESLNHNYTQYYEAIVDKLHSNISIHDDAIALYKTPIFSKDIIYFRDDTTINSTIGKLNFTCGTDFTNYNIDSINSAYFAIDEDKNIKLTATPPIDGIYEVKVDVSNNDNEHISANLSLQMVKVSVPTLINSNFTNIISDSIESDYELGRAVYINSQAPIIDVYLSGFGYENFNIDKNGYISIAQNHNIKREDSVYNFQIFATNDDGLSLPANISIRVYTLGELSPKLKDTYIDINSADISVGKIIGTMNKEVSVFCPIISFVSDYNTTFGIYPNGNIYVNNIPTQENYTLNVRSKSECGDSNNVSLIIDRGNKILCEMSTYYAKGAVLSNDNKIIYVADGRSGLKIINISNPTNPFIVGYIDTYDANHITLKTDNKIAFMADGKYGLKIIDISNSSNPFIVGLFQTTYAQKIILSHDNTKAYIADGGGGLKIINITNPSNPTLIASLEGYSIYDIALSKDGTKIYAASGFGGLRIIDVSNSLTPIHINSLETTYARGVTVISDNIIYVADSSDGLKIVDIANPSNPNIVSSFKTSNAYKASALSNNQKIFLADGNGGLKVIDTSDSMQPYLLSSIAMSDAKDVIVSKDNTKVIIVDAEGGLKIIDI